MTAKRKLIDSIIQNRVLSHLLLWSSFLLFSSILATLNSGAFIDHVIKYVTILPSQILAAYCLTYYQVPAFLLKKKYISFFISFIISVYFFSALARISVVHIAEPFIREDFEQETLQEIITDPDYLFSVYFPAVYSIAFLMLIIKIIKQRFDEKQQIEVLKKEKVTNELKFLRTQIQPHFLFNTLNNLYALTLAKSDLAPKVVLKLSEMLDFILHQSNESEIPIYKELELVQGFIDLETLRYGDSLHLTFNTEIDNPNTQISPLILLPFVENAFKHGANGNFENPTIKIEVQLTKEELTFEVYNTKPKLIEEDKANKKGGIGIANLKRQLELNYPNKHTLEIHETLESYLVTLKIELK